MYRERDMHTCVCIYIYIERERDYSEMHYSFKVYPIHHYITCNIMYDIIVWYMNHSTML